MLLSLTGIAGAKSEVRRQDHCAATDRFTIWKGTFGTECIQYVISNWILYILTLLITSSYVCIL